MDTEKKVDYIVYATRSLMDGKLEVDEYFRVCNVIVRLIYEDLQYLKDNIYNKNITYNMSVQALLNDGIISREQSPVKDYYTYLFTPFAEQVYKYAICLEDHHFLNIQDPKPGDSIKIASNKDIDDLF